MKDRVLATAVLAGLLGFLIPLYQFLDKIQSWEVMWNPPGVAHLIACTVSGLVAIGAALGINVRMLLIGFWPDRFERRAVRREDIVELPPFTPTPVSVNPRDP